MRKTKAYFMKVPEGKSEFRYPRNEVKIIKG
jgi:hypothetical protein